MKKMDAYGLRICEYQAELFASSMKETKCSSAMFIRRFMNSDLAKRIDREGYLFESSTVSDGYAEIDMQYGSSEYGREKYGKEELYWIGYIYRYWSYTYEKSSRQIYKLVKPGELRKLYFPYHSLDPAQAIERILETKDIKTPEDIQRGVEILKKIRSRV